MMHRTLSNVQSSSSKEETTKTTMMTDDDIMMSSHRLKTSRRLGNCKRILYQRHSLCTVLLLCVTFCYLLRTSSGQFLDANQRCEVTNSEGTVEYSACVGSPEPLFLLGLTTTLDPPNATCGSNSDPTFDLFCTLGVDTVCNLCNATDSELAHPPEFMYDNDNGANTWWQSVSWYDYPTPLHVNVTVSLGHSYRISNDLTFVFKYGRPQLMILEKSNDYGATWETYQYYAAEERGCKEGDTEKAGCDGRVTSGCQLEFGMPVTQDEDLSSPTQVICTDQYSSTVRVTDTDVEFLINDRILLLADSPRQADLINAYEANKEFQAFLDVTDLRLQLLYPPTDGLEFSAQQSLFGLGKYYYAIADINSVVTCNCNLHGKYCISNAHGNETICECFHNTQGVNCEQCKPLYNNRPWRAGSNLPFGVGTANECQKCDCGDHADSCVYDPDRGFGTCIDCQHNTAGLLCEICVDGYFRNTSALKTDPDVCIECSCEPLGTVLNEANMTLCSQYADEEQGIPIGQCDCKDNIRGRACDMCAEGFYGLTIEPNPGICKDCGCNLLGTIDGSNVCEELTGQCPCKQSTTTRTCAECADTYYAFPGDIQAECLPCNCDPGGATSLACNKDSGRCACRGSISGRACSNPATLFYCSYLDSNSYDAWEASSTCTKKSDRLNRSLFSGQGFQVCEADHQVVFEGVMVATGSDNTKSYSPIIRYSYTSNFDWENARLTIRSNGNSAVVTDSDCPDTPGTQIWTSTVMFSPGTALAALPRDDAPVSLDKRCMYQFTLEIQSSGAGAREIEIDALVLMPNINETLVYQIADTEQQQSYENCLQGMSALSTRSDVVRSCGDFSFSVCAELNGRALSCSCNFTGSRGSVCVAYGGDCNCKTGVGGRQCDRCLPGYYGFSENGCTPCNCDEQGSESLACDYVAGQCPCKAGVAQNGQSNSNGELSGLQCRTCLANYYGFGGDEGCVACGCNEIGSLTLQCDGGGFCTCKETITGQRCENCVPGYFGFKAEGCDFCECNPAGTIGSTCHPTEGSCTCKANVEGDKCDQCQQGFFNMQLGNPDGCQRCFCYGHGSECSAATGYVASEVKTDFTGGRIDGWVTSDPTAVNVNPSNIRISQPPNLESGTFLYLMAPTKFLNFKLSSYGQQMSYRMKLDTGTVDKTDAKYLIMIGGRLNRTLFYSHEAFEPTIQATTFQAMLYETYWTLDGEDRNPTAAEFLEILANIESIQIKATFGTGTASTFYSIAMETVRIGEPTGNQGYVTMVENCTCNANTMGMSCEFCNIGHRRSEGLSDPYDGCIACNCNNRATECDPETGVCLDCQLGTVGDQCQDCATNVQTPNCDRCVTGHYGFGTELFGGACEACNCSTIGTSNNAQCDNLSGQCTCVGNYGGMQCDKCDYNFYNFDEGCVACDSCYDGIDSQYESLATSNSNLTNYVELLLSQDNTLNVGPFVERLTSIQTILLDLVARTQMVIREGEDLSTIISSLNVTMHQLLYVLGGPIEQGIDLANVSVAQVELGVTIAQESIAVTEAALKDAHYAITGGDIQQAQTTLSGLNSDLQQIENSFNSLTTQSELRVNTLSGQANTMEAFATQMVMTAEGAVQLAQEANSIHDNTTSRTAALFAQANEVDAADDQLVTDAETTRQRASATLAESQNKRAEVADINTGLPVTTSVVNDAKGRVQQAVQIEQNADDKLASSQEIIDNVNASAVRTETLITDANNTIDTVDNLYDRVTLADEKAQSARTLTDNTFVEAEATKSTLSDFNAQVTAAKNAAGNALDGAAAIVESSNSVIGETTALRNQLSTAASDAEDGLSIAEEAFTTAEEEKMNLEPVNIRANLLSARSQDSSLNSIDSIVNTIASINTSYVHPAAEVCNSFTAGIQTLEEIVTRAVNDSDTATTRTAATEEEITRLMTEIENIGAIDTSGLTDLQVRVEAAQKQFTEAQFEQVIAGLKQGVEEQEIWLMETAAEVRSMRDQIDALDSFRVN